MGRFEGTCISAKHHKEVPPAQRATSSVQRLFSQSVLGLEKGSFSWKTFRVSGTYSERACPERKRDGESTEDNSEFWGVDFLNRPTATFSQQPRARLVPSGTRDSSQSGRASAKREGGD